MDERAEVVLVGEVEGPVCLVDPPDRALQSAACVEACGAWVGQGRGLGLCCRLVDVGPLRREEIKVAHSSPRNARCWREAKRASSWVRDASSAVLVPSVSLSNRANLRWSAIGGIGTRSPAISLVFTLNCTEDRRVTLRNAARPTGVSSHCRKNSGIKTSGLSLIRMRWESNAHALPPGCATM